MTDNTQHPQVTEQRIDDVVVKATYFQPSDTTTTICMLTLLNGFIVLGKSACVDPAKFDEELGQQYALLDARRQVCELEGYLLRQWMYLEQQGAFDPAPSIVSAFDGKPLLKGVNT